LKYIKNNMPEESSFRLTEVVALGDGTGLSSNRRLLLLPPIVSKSNIFRRSGAGKCFSTKDWNTPLDDNTTHVNHMIVILATVQTVKHFNINNFFAFSPVQITRGHPYKLVPRAAINTRKHFFWVRVIEPWNSLVGTEEDFSTLRRFMCLLGRTDSSPYLRYTE